VNECPLRTSPGMAPDRAGVKPRAWHRKGVPGDEPPGSWRGGAAGMRGIDFSASDSRLRAWMPPFVFEGSFTPDKTKP
jgi:hypothetical protein